MPVMVHGLHHVTAIARDGQTMIDFYSGLLGLRLVKQSVNQDATDTYHLFFADAAGSPGTDLTFFIWNGIEPARPGVGFTVETAFAVPPGSLDYWQERFARIGQPAGPPEIRFGEPALAFRDPDGLPLTLVEAAGKTGFVPWAAGPVPREHQLRGLHSVRLHERSLELTEILLTQVLGFELLGEQFGWRRYGVNGGGPGRLIDLQALPDERLGRWGYGGVHHVAWRVADETEQLALRGALMVAGLAPTNPIDRFWFQSVYFKEPGGALFELATDGPGFDRDEDPAHLGERLSLPPWLEPQRAIIETGLPPLAPPHLLI